MVYIDSGYVQVQTLIMSYDLLPVSPEPGARAGHLQLISNTLWLGYSLLDYNNNNFNKFNRNSLIAN